MADDPQIYVHRTWLNMLQPTGLVVSPPALVAAQCVPDRQASEAQQRLQALVDEYDERYGSFPKSPPAVASFVDLARDLLQWDLSFVAGMEGGPTIPDTLQVVLAEFNETLRPTYAVQNLDSAPDAPPWQLLVVSLARGTNFDHPGAEEGRGWHASPQVRLERLLRETGVLAGVLFNGDAVRLVCAPRGESSGHLTWPIYALCEVQGRPLLSALCMLLGKFRLFSAPRAQSILTVLRESRKYQSVVSTTLAAQVLEALNELLRGFQAANAATHGKLLDDVAIQDPEHIYGGLLGVLLRLVFILFAEERGLLANERIYSANYALTGLFEQLRIDAGRYPDTMDQRYGAWARICVLVRMIYDGAKHGAFELLPRQGHLFDPDAWPFLEGRPYGAVRQLSERLAVPRVSDGVVFRVLEKLLVLDGDRLSYRALDVEQIGSVYENMMGFALERAPEISLGVGAKHVVVGLETLLAVKPADRVKALKESSDTELTGKAAEALKQATTVDALVAAIGRRASSLTPRPVPCGGFYLQPGEERRRSGSHYTPRELTSPVVRTTLEPLLAAFGPSPTPDEILGLRVCDPAMGSGAFLVETCRQLAEALVQAWDVYGRPAQLKADEDPLLFAQRQVAQRCLYGVDRNRLAVDLAKLSLWLATLAREHAFSFVDHALREGDSLVGLSRDQIAAFHWEPSSQLATVRRYVEPSIERAEELRARIQDLATSDDDGTKRELLREADEALDDVRLVGDCVIACFFSADKDKERRRALALWQTKIIAWLSEGVGRDEVRTFVEATLREGARPIRCFHWEIEFPEVFARSTTVARVGAAS
jgi:hypothetical protein